MEAPLHFQELVSHSPSLHILISWDFPPSSVTQQTLISAPWGDLELRAEIIAPPHPRVTLTHVLHFKPETLAYIHFHIFIALIKTETICFLHNN